MLELEWPSCSRRHMNTKFPLQAAAVPPITVSHKRAHKQGNYIDKKDEKDILRQTGLQNPTPAPRPPHRSASQETPP